VLLVSHMSTRLQIPKWLNDLGLTNEAVEVGTHRGEYARVFAEKWKGKLFHCVDPWYNPPEYESHQMVVYDVWNWWVKVKPGGIFAGHDIVCPGPKNEENWGRNIQPVLFDFAEKQRVDIYLIVEETNTNWSWYVHKPEGK
jgi:hypothetical protein